MSLERNGRLYGDGTVVGDNGDEFLKKTDVEKAFDLAWSNGCPVPIRLIKPKDQGGRGAREMVLRYAQINFWFGNIKAALQKAGKTEILDKLSSPQRRRENEPLGTHDEGWIPTELADHAYGLGTPIGYALGRIVIPYIDKDPNNTFKAMDIIEESINSSGTATELLVTMAQRLVDAGAPEKSTIKEMVSLGKLGEDNSFHDYHEIVQTMKDKGVGLYYTYRSMDSDELRERRIAEIGI